jgi:hypothetical protein
MPDRHLYEDVAASSADFIRVFAEAHYAPDIHRISDYEYEMLRRAADELDRTERKLRLSVVPPPPPPSPGPAEWAVLWSPEGHRRSPRPS